MNRTEKSIKLNILALAIPALVCVLICSLILSGMTFSWFTDTYASSANLIKTASFVTSKTVTDSLGVAITPDANGKYSLPAGVYFVTVDASAANTNGYTTMYLGDVPFLQTALLNDSALNTQVTYTLNVTLTTTPSATITFADSWDDPQAGLTTVANGLIYNITETSVASAAALANMPQTYSFGGVSMIIDPVYGYIYDLNGGIYYDPFNFENYYTLDPVSGNFTHVETGELFNPATGRNVDSETGYEIDPETGYLIDPVSSFLIHPITNRLVYTQTEAVTEGDVITEEIILIDVLTAFETDAETGYLIEPLTGRFIHAETMYYVIEGSDYLIIPATSYLYNPILGTYHDPLTYEEVTEEVALGIPADEDLLGGEETEDDEEIDDPEVVEDGNEPIIDEPVIEDPVIDDSEITDDTVVTYSPIDGFVNVPDTLEYQVVPYLVDDMVYGACRMLYNTTDGTYINLTADALLYTDPTTGFFMIPGSAYQLIPATGYLYDTVYENYLDPTTMLLTTYDVALGLVVDEVPADDATEGITPVEPEAEVTTTVTEETTTDETSVSESDTTVSETEPAVTSAEVSDTTAETTAEPEVTTVSEAEAEVTSTEASE